MRKRDFIACLQCDGFHLWEVACWNSLKAQAWDLLISNRFLFENGPLDWVHAQLCFQLSYQLCKLCLSGYLCKLWIEKLEFLRQDLIVVIDKEMQILTHFEVTQLLKFCELQLPLLWFYRIIRFLSCLCDFFIFSFIIADSSALLP